MRLRRTVRDAASYVGPWHEAFPNWAGVRCSAPRSRAYSRIEEIDSSEVDDLAATACQRCLAASPEFEAVVAGEIG